MAKEVALSGRKPVHRGIDAATELLPPRLLARGATPLSSRSVVSVVGLTREGGVGWDGGLGRVIQSEWPEDPVKWSEVCEFYQ